MKNEYIFPAVLDYSDDGISIEFPDLPGCLPCASTTEEALNNAKEALALHLYGMENDNEPIPEPTPVNRLETEKNQAVMLIDAFMPPFREKLRNRSVKKTLSIPSWLNSLAEQADAPFSQILQKGLKEYLNIRE